MAFSRKISRRTFLQSGVACWRNDQHVAVHCDCESATYNLWQITITLAHVVQSGRDTVTTSKISSLKGYSIVAEGNALGIVNGFLFALKGQTKRDQSLDRPFRAHEHWIYSEGEALGYDGSGRWPECANVDLNCYS